MKNLLTQKNQIINYMSRFLKKKNRGYTTLNAITYQLEFSLKLFTYRF